MRATTKNIIMTIGLIASYHCILAMQSSTESHNRTHSGSGYSSDADYAASSGSSGISPALSSAGKATPPPAGFGLPPRADTLPPMVPPEKRNSRKTECLITTALGEIEDLFHVATLINAENDVDAIWNIVASSKQARALINQQLKQIPTDIDPLKHAIVPMLRTLMLTVIATIEKDGLHERLIDRINQMESRIEEIRTSTEVNDALRARAASREAAQREFEAWLERNRQHLPKASVDVISDDARNRVAADL